MAALIVALAVVAAGCSDSGDGNSNTTTSESKEVVLVTHDSFAIPKQVKATFEKESGLKLTILQGGDAGEMVNRALLTKGNPQGDVLFGIDNNLLSRALDEGLFEPYVAGGLEFVDAALPDRPDPCGDADRPRRRLPQRRPEVVRLARSRAAADARRPDAAALQGPARRREPRHLDARAGLHARHHREVRRGRLAGLLAPAAGERRARRRRLGGGVHGPVLRRRRQQGQAADRRLLRHEPGGRGDLREDPPKTAPTAVVADSCFRQIEFAGVLDGARNPNGARAFIDFMLSKRFQASMPESMFVLPVRDGTPLPEAFQKYAVSPPSPLELPAEEIGDNRDRWIDEWTQVVLR